MERFKFGNNNKIINEFVVCNSDLRQLYKTVIVSVLVEPLCVMVQYSTMITEISK